MPAPAPPLQASEVAGGGVRLTLQGLARGEGPSLQEAADDLVSRVLLMAMAFRSSGLGPMSSECRVDLGLLEFLFELSEIGARGEDIRPRLFGGGWAS